MTAAITGLRTERRALLATLVGLAALGWIVVVWQAVVMDDGMSMGDMGEAGIDLTMGMAAPLFLAMWLAMMVAMMFPASAPMIVAFTRAQERRRADGKDAVPAWVFVAPYLAVWVVFGAAGYGLAVAADELAEGSTWAMDNIPRVAGGLLVAAGVYQMTPVKRVCLKRCRTPLSFMLSYWREGRRGAVNMGLRHGLFCLGCCWVLFVVLLPLGVMNVPAMVVVAAVVFAEKALPAGERVATVAAVVLIVYGAVAIVVPDALPTTVT